jgi:hypothetical protein
MRICVFDIETGPLSKERIEEIAPPFNENKIKTGNLGLEKALAKVNEARANHIESIFDKAALRGEYGQVLACGFAEGLINATPPIETVFGEGSDPYTSERNLLRKIWERIKQARENRALLVGHNSNTFDLPMLLRRSFILGIPPYREILPKNARFFPDFCLDTLDLWKMGDYDPKSKISLDRLAKAMGIEGKSGSGKFFSQLMAEDFEAAKAYLETDIRVTWEVAARLVPLTQPNY